MNKEKLILGLVLFVLGLIGVLSMLTMNIPIPEEASKVLLAQFTPQQIKFLLLLNPSIMLVVGVFLGVFVYDKVLLGAPIITGITNNKWDFELWSILKFGVFGGIISGILITLIAAIYSPFLPLEFIELAENLKPSLAARFLYGGITEEILMRFGLMTFLVFIFSKIFKSLNAKSYWISIAIAAIIFAIGHFPIAFQSISNPSAILLSYILIGNSVGGIIFGWLYWKKGLESAFIAHAVTHVVMLLGEPLFQ